VALDLAMLHQLFILMSCRVCGLCNINIKHWHWNYMAVGVT